MARHRGSSRPKAKPAAPVAGWLRGHWRAVAVTGLALLVLTVVSLPRPKRPPGTPAAAPSSSKIPARLIRDEKTAFDAYGGSASCKECHEEAYELWAKSNHGLAERPLSAEQDRRAFVPSRSFKHGTQRTDVRLEGGQSFITAKGLSGAPETHAAVRVIGNDPLRQFLVRFPGGRYQTHEASYDPHRNDWFNVYGEEDRQPGEWGHWTGRGMNWNNMCAGCHNTRLRKNYVEPTDSYATTMVELTVGCEACHGPMKDHNVWRKAHPNTTLPDPTIRKLDTNQVFDTCATCHSRRMELTGDFLPGESYYDHHSLVVVDETDLYYPDGQVRDEDYEYAAFLGSRMYRGGIRCRDCHNYHSAKTLLSGNLLCLRCHDGSLTNSPIIDPVKHGFHKLDPLYSDPGGIDLIAIANRNRENVVTNGAECINCHMPQTYYMQRHLRHDHGFTIPDPLLTKQHGIPNACNRCHTDKDVDWSIEWVNKWYGAKMDRPSRRRTQIVAAGRRGEPAARDGLLSLLATNEPPYWRAVAARLLDRWVTDPPVTAALVQALKHTNALVRGHVARTLGHLVEANSLDARVALWGALADPVRSVRFEAAWALRSSLDPQSPAGREMLQVLDYVADQPTGQLQKGAYFLSRGDPRQALTHYQKAVDWDPNSAAMRHELAVTLSMLNRGPEAVGQLEAACRLEPRDAEFRYKLGLAWAETGRTDKALEALEAAVRLDPRHTRAWYNLGLARSAVGRSQEAIQALVRAESLEPRDPRPPYARATILARLGNRAEARQAARRALEIQPGFSEAQQLLRSLQ